jgi:pimeloyl-ACP methyl ester carboxylesterase
MNEIALRADVRGAEIEPPPAWNRLAEVAVPALVTWGDLDFPSVVETCEHLATTIRGARRHMFAGAAHLPNLEQPAAFNRVLLGFCASGAAKRA